MALGPMMQSEPIRTASHSRGAKRVVQNLGSLRQLYRIIIAPQHRAKPDPGMQSQTNAADHRCGGD
jgi:hypothetical protein